MCVKFAREGPPHHSCKVAVRMCFLLGEQRIQNGGVTLSKCQNCAARRRSLAPQRILLLGFSMGGPKCVFDETPRVCEC